MKALTLWQPWASLMAYGLKRYETRSWTTDYRGPLAIHAAKTHEGLLAGVAFEEALFSQGVRVLPFGAVVCVGELVAVHPTCPLVREISEQERGFGDWRCGRYAWEFVVQEIYPEGVEARGFQGLWDWYAYRVGEKVSET